MDNCYNNPLVKLLHKSNKKRGNKVSSVKAWCHCDIHNIDYPCVEECPKCNSKKRIELEEPTFNGRLLNNIFIQSIWRSQHPNEIAINEEALKQIFDEVRKEFPYDDLMTLMATYECGGCVSIKKWYEKYFGDKKLFQ